MSADNLAPGDPPETLPLDVRLSWNATSAILVMPR
jgi:hypothetical protein